MDRFLKFAEKKLERAIEKVLDPAALIDPSASTPYGPSPPTHYGQPPPTHYGPPPPTNNHTTPPPFPPSYPPHQAHPPPPSHSPPAPPVPPAPPAPSKSRPSRLALSKSRPSRAAPSDPSSAVMDHVFAPSAPITSTIGMLEHSGYTANAHYHEYHRRGAALQRLEASHASTAGPQWRCDPPAMINGQDETTASILRLSLSSVEIGTTFAAFNRRRYDVVGRAVLERVLLGLSRPLDLSRGEAELFNLAQDVRSRAPSVQAGIAVDDITIATIPIFAVSYRRAYAPESALWGMDPAQTRQLFFILRCLTGGGTARIWCDAIARLHFSKGARLERTCLGSFALFPTIRLCDPAPPAPLRSADEEEWWTVQHALAMSAWGVISVDGTVLPIIKTGQGNEVNLRSGVWGQLMKHPGDDGSMDDVLHSLVRKMLCEPSVSVEGERSETVAEMRRVAVQLLRGDGLEKVVMGLGCAGSVYGLGAAAMREDVFRGIAARAVPVTSPRFSAAARRSAQAGGMWRRGVGMEFVRDGRLAEVLEMGAFARRYTCFFRNGCRDMFVIVTLESTPQLTGVVMVERAGDGCLAGSVTFVVSNVKAADVAALGKMEGSGVVPFMTGVALQYMTAWDNGERMDHQTPEEAMQLAKERWQFQVVKEAYVGWR